MAVFQFLNKDEKNNYFLMVFRDDANYLTCNVLNEENKIIKNIRSSNISDFSKELTAFIQLRGIEYVKEIEIDDELKRQIELIKRIHKI